MKGSNYYGAQPIKLETFNGAITSITGNITAAEAKRFDNGEKIVLTLDDEWSLVVNATAYRVIRAEYGDETDEWIGRPITAYKGTVVFRGNSQEGICVRIPEAVQPPDKLDPINAELSEVSAANAAARTNGIPF